MRKQPPMPDYEGGHYQNFGSFHANNNSFMSPPAVMNNPGVLGPNGSMVLNPIDRLYSMQNLYFCGEKLADEQM